MFSAMFRTMKRLLTRRDPRWRKAEQEHLRIEPLCQWCRGKVKLQVHHIVPFHEDRSKELDPENHITLCMAPELECHYRKGHKGTSWNDWDPNIRQKCQQHQKGKHP